MREEGVAEVGRKRKRMGGVEWTCERYITQGRERPLISSQSNSQQVVFLAKRQRPPPEVVVHHRAGRVVGVVEQQHLAAGRGGGRHRLEIWEEAEAALGGC
jgi:hypothetical protein